MGTALMEIDHEEVAVERTHTLLGPGYSVIGSFRREVTSQADLAEVSDYLLETAKQNEVELDGYALQRAADLSDLDLFAMGAQQLLHAGRAAEAVQFCEEGLAQHGPHLELLALLAYSSIKSGDLDTAARVLDDLYPMLDPDASSPAMTWNVACACALLGRKPEALEMLRQAIDSNPEFIELARSEADLDSLKDEVVFRELLAV